MKPIEPQIIDGMPREVATAMLTEPRAQLSNRMRKVCMRARDKVFVSSSPITKSVAIDDDGTTEWVHSWTEQAPLEVEIKTAERFSYATLQQLGKWCSRAIKRRAVVQRAYLAVPTEDNPRNNALRELYAALASKLDVIRDCAEDEINLRLQRCNEIDVIHQSPLLGNKVYFRAKPTAAP